MVRFACSRNPSWWKRRSRLERVLAAATACLMCVSVALVVSLAVVSVDVPEESGLEKGVPSPPRTLLLAYMRHRS